MKIICRRCKKVIGEQAPYKDNAEIKAKCSECIAKDKIVGARFTPKSELSDGQEITLDNGLKGRLWAVKDKSNEISLFEIAVSGKRFFCADQIRNAFKQHVDQVKTDDVDVSFLHSMKCKIDDLKKRPKKDDPAEPKNKRSEAIQYNCTVTVPKDFALSIFDSKVNQFHEIAGIIQRAGARSFDEFRDMAINRQREAVK